MIAGLCQGNIIAPLIFNGPCNSAVFEAYIKTQLIKQLKRGQIVVMDNISFHKTAEVAELIK